MFYGAFLGPIGAILIFNFIVFVIVARTAIQHRRKTSAKGTSVVGLILRLIGVTFLLGMTWVFGALTVVSQTSLAFQILFAIFNSSQGFFLFLFFCVLNKDARESWKRILLHFHHKQSFQSHPLSHTKGRYPPSATRSTLHNATHKNSDLRFSTSEQLANQISTRSEIGAFGEVYENPVTDISAREGSGVNEITSEGSDQIENYFFEDNPDSTITVIQNQHAASPNPL